MRLAHGCRSVPFDQRPLHPSGVSLLELLVAVACTLLLAGAVFSLLVTSALAGRRQWGEVASRAAARAAVASVGEDLRIAGRGIEHADAVQRNGEVIRLVSSGPSTLLRAVLPVGQVHEIWNYVGPSTYVVESIGAPAVGLAVAAVDQPMRPATAPLPVGVVVGKTRRGMFVELSVAWHAAEAAIVSAWGRPRALAPLLVREYEIRSAGGSFQLRRRDLGGSWQPIVEGLDTFEIFWVLDTDADGVPDARRPTWTGGSGTRACAVQLEARALRSATRLAGAGPSVNAGPEAARRWIRLRGC